jgi:long-chain acyl-CoA synthetase
VSALEALREALGPGGSGASVSDRTGTLDAAALADRVRLWTERLDALGARRVAWQLPNGADWIALDLAVLLTGRIAVPVPDFFSEAQRTHVLDAAGIDTFVGPAEAPAPTACHAEAAFGAAVAHRRALGSPPPVHAGTAKITFTSGTTGTPKGVCLSAEHLLATAASIRSALGDRGIGKHLCVLPLSLLLENVAGIYANLLHGSEIVAVPLTDVGLTGSSGLDVEAWVAAQGEHRPHSMILVPQLLLATTLAAEFGLDLPDAYRFVAVGGGRVAPELLRRAEAVGLPVFEGYGLSECGSVVTLNRPSAVRHGTTGRALAHADVTVRGGEVFVSRATMLGYLGAEAAGPEIATGDLGTLDEDGFLRVHGRRRNVFVTAFGRNVSPEWIEGELQAELPVAQAVAFGEGLAENVALLVPRGEADDDALADAVARANARLPDYARIGSWHRISPERFAAAGCLTENGRVRRDRVAEAFGAELPGIDLPIDEESHDPLPATAARD